MDWTHIPSVIMENTDPELRCACGEPAAYSEPNRMPNPRFTYGERAPGVVQSWCTACHAELLAKVSRRGLGFMGVRKDNS